MSVGIPTAPAYASLTHELVYELLLIGGLGLIGLALGLAGARRALGRPLASLTATARRLQSGDLSARTGAVSRGGELGELAASIDAWRKRSRSGTAERERAGIDLVRLAGDLEGRIQSRTERPSRRLVRRPIRASQPPRPPSCRD